MRWVKMPVLVALAAMAIPQAAFAYAPTGPAGPVELSQPWAVPAPAGGDASVMFTLHNFGDVPDNLIHATCAIAESTELVGPARPGAAPAQLNQIVLGPAQQIALAPDSIHLVLHHLYAATQPGQTLHCTATFSRSGERLFEAEVRQSAPPPAPPI